MSVSHTHRRHARETGHPASARWIPADAGMTVAALRSFDEGFIRRKFPLAKLSAARYADAAEKALGPFAVENKSDTQPGCR